jgi:hypothetical protein
MRTALLLLTVACLGFAPLPLKKPKDTRTVAEKARDGDLLLEYRAFHGEPWLVFARWLADQTHTPLVMSYRPAGGVTFVPPYRLTSAEFLDALNRELLARNARIVRKEKCYILVPADDE